MSFAKIIEKGVKIADKLTTSLQTSVTHYPWISAGDHGEPNYGSPVTRQAIVDFNDKIYRDKTGREILQKAMITIPRAIAANGAADRKEPVDPRDKFVLPNGYTGPIIGVSGTLDPNTNLLYAVEIRLG